MTLNHLMYPRSTSPKRMADMKIKTGARVFALSALAAMMISHRLSPKLKKKGKLVIWINGDKGYNGFGQWVKNSKKTPVSKSP